MKAQGLARTAGVFVTAATAVLGVQSVAHASAPSVVYVSPGEVTTAALPQGYGGGCDTTQVHSIQQGVDMVATGGKVIVCAGTYPESVNILKRLTLQGLKGAIVDATGQPFGIGAGANYVKVDGMTVRNAGVNGPQDGPGDGIVTAAFGPYGEPQVGNYLTITGNVLTGNVGAGIDMISTRGSVIQGNRSTGNGIGINVVDDFGVPVQNNKIEGNVASNNKTGCGIALASHTGAGVIGNLVENNIANRNGLPAGGAGILLATPTPGAVIKNNQLLNNTANGNGHAGVEVHIHPGGVNASGNSIVGNSLGTNNTGGDTDDPETTAIYLGSNSPMTIVVKNNHMHDDVNGIFKAGPITAQRSGNTFTNVDHPFVSIPTYNG